MCSWHLVSTILNVKFSVVDVGIDHIFLVPWQHIPSLSLDVAAMSMPILLPILVIIITKVKAPMTSMFL